MAMGCWSTFSALFDPQEKPRQQKYLLPDKCHAGKTRCSDFCENTDKHGQPSGPLPGKATYLESKL